MRYLIRLRVFLLCCLFMIGMNVVLVVDGVITTGPVADEMKRQPGNAAACMSREKPADRTVNRLQQ
jgi:hypothetical protein